MGWADEFSAAAPVSSPAAASAAAKGASGSWSSEFASAVPTAPAPPPPPPRTAMQLLGDGANALQHNFFKPLEGAAQFVQNTIDKGLQQLPDNPISRKWHADALSDQAVLDEWEREYQASTPDGIVANSAGVAGGVLPWLMGGIPNGLRAAGQGVASRLFPAAEGAAPSLLAKATSGATQGAIVGASEPVFTPQQKLSDLVTGAQPPSYWDQKLGQIEGGAAFGAAFPVAATGVGAAWNRARSAVAGSAALNPAGYAANQVRNELGPDAAAVASKLANAPEYVPGSMPTSAQAGANPRLVQLEKALANQSDKFKGRLLARENSNNAARLQAVAQVAQTPEALQAAIDARNAATAPMRDFTVTNGNPVPVAPVSGAISSVVNGPFGVSDTIGPAARAMGNKLSSFTKNTAPDTLMNVPGSSTASPSMLDALRQQTNSYLDKNAPGGFAGTQEQAAVMPIKSAIIDAIDAANPRRAPGGGGWGQGLEQAGPTAPGYRDYLDEFAKRSMPANTMEVGQALKEALSAKPMDSNGNPLATLTNYNAALGKALRGSDYAIDPQAQAALEAVGSDLQRATISNSVKSAGDSGTAYNQGAGAAFLRALGAGGDANGKAAVAGAAMLAATGSAKTAGAAVFGTKKASEFVANRVANSLGELLLDPQKLAEALGGGTQALTTTAPSAFGRLTGRLTPAAKTALIAQVLQRQAPQVVGPNAQQAEAYQP